MNSRQNPPPSRKRFDTLGGRDPGEREDELAVAGVTEPVSGADTLGGPDMGPEDELGVAGVTEPVSGADTLGGPDTGPEDELAVPDAGQSRDARDDADSGERPGGRE